MISPSFDASTEDRRDSRHHARAALSTISSNRLQTARKRNIGKHLALAVRLQTCDNLAIGVFVKIRISMKLAKTNTGATRCACVEDEQQSRP
jgi:hypothetical protein